VVHILPRRVLLALVLIVALVTAGLAAWTLSRPGPARAQELVAHDTEVFANLVDTTDSSGNIHLGFGSDDVFDGPACSPTGPRTGSNIPAQLVTDVQATDTIMRAFRQNGTVLASRGVRFTCTIDFGPAPGAPTAATIRAKLKGLQQNP
jgi:hypothetical protein